MEQQKQYKFLILLSGLCATLLQLCLLMQNNLIAIGQTFVSTTIFVYPLTCVLLDIIAEVYGYNVAKKTLWTMIITSLIFGLIIHFSMQPPMASFWTHYDQQYDAAMAPVLNSTLINLMAVIVGQYINIYAITKLKILTRGRFFALRSMTSSMVGDTITISIALSLIFNSRMGYGSVFEIVRNEILCMYAAAIIFSLPATLVNYLLKRAEQISGGVYFNPFAKNN